VTAVAASLHAFAIVAGVACAWVGVFELNGDVFAHLEHSERAHWIFLPAALRVLSVLLFQRLGAAGLVIGSYFTLSADQGYTLVQELFLSISSGMAPLLAVLFCQRFFTFKVQLEGLRGVHILALSLACAATNSLVLNSYLMFSLEQKPALLQVGTVFVGDVLGSVIVLTAIAVGLLALERLRVIRLGS